VTSLIKAAEIALVDARNNPRLFSIYSEEIAGTDLYSLDIETELDKAVDNDELSLYFQPQINLSTGQIYGAEALIRWRHPDKGFIRPDIFIPIAEHSGQIHKLTWWTLNTALRLIKEWPGSHSHLKVAINISAKVLKDLSFVDSVRSALKFWNVSSNRLTLEITESALMEDLTTSFITLEELKAMGFGISIDDFGTGYSSMAYFKNIPAIELKIDQSFVFYMMENPMDKHIVTTIIGLAHGFNLNVVAEGIENERTFDTLKQLGCDIAQGFHIARPMPQTEFVNWVNQYNET
ncbi:MAG: EAL domain-containing protein, partial [Gammaproteobacteria bacterium]|nr:EAL domain-containing protein [Gammaproteobacteria bacterium]